MLYSGYSWKFNYSGELSHVKKLPPNAKFIGLLSRFSETKTEFVPESYDIVILLSGPEPQRTILENKCVKLLKDQGKKMLHYPRHAGESQTKENTKEITWYNHFRIQNLKRFYFLQKK
jgi:hypothetical protein